MLELFMKFFVAFVISASGTQAFAVPSVRHLGGAVPDTSEKTVTVTPVAIKSNASVVKAAKPQSAVTNEDDSARLSVLNTINTINVNKIKQPTVSSAGSQPVKAGVSEEAFMQIVDRVDAIEQKADEALNDVVESGNGRYVTDVTTEGTKLKVEKTRLLYAPVRNNGSDTIVSDAEIWIVK